MARSADSDMINWEIADSQVLRTEVVGNAANRFDTQRQNGTLGPYPPAAAGGPDETEGEPGSAPTSN